MFEEPPVVEEEKEEFVYRRQTRVTAAITVSHLESWENGFCVPDLSMFLEKEGFKRGGPALSDTRAYAQFLYTTFWKNQTSLKPLDRGILSTAKDLTQLGSLNWANCDFSLPITDLYSEHIISKLNGIRAPWDKMIQTLSNSTNRVCHYEIKQFKTQFHFYGDYCVVTHRGKKVFMTWLMLLAFQDSIIGLMDCCMFSFLHENESGVPLYQDVAQMVVDGIETICNLGEEAYDVFKALHPGAVGRILLLESIYTNPLFEETVKDMPDCPIKVMLQAPLEDDLAHMKLLTLCGMAKCFTYPVIYIQESVDNVTSKSGVFNPDRNGGNMSLWYFRRTFCYNYLRRHKEWPPLTITGPIRGDLSRSIASGAWAEPRNNKWSLLEFKNIELQKILDLNLKVDETDLLSDKAIAVGLDSWPREYDRRYHRLLYGYSANPGPIKNRRLLIEHIKREEVSVFYDATSFLKGDDKTSKMAVMCLKERELNRKKGRFFTKQTMKGRQYQLLLEENMKPILSYVPLTSMILSGDSLLKYCLNQSADPNTAKVSVDFSKWCQYQRQGLIGPIASEIDRIYGSSPIYECAHLVPLDLWWFFQDSSRPPQQSADGEPCAGDRAFPGLHSMGEGMYQKLWTLVTGCGIMAQMYKRNLECGIMGSGDNQYISCKIPNDMGPREVQRAIFEGLEEFSSICKLPIKLEETFVSSHYMEYGRTSYLRGKRIPQALKRASRIGTESQETIPSVNTKLSGVFATGIATASECGTPASAYAVTIIESCLALEARGFQGGPTRMGALLILGRQLGGVKSSPYAAFCIRGLNDTATVGVSVLQTLIKYKDSFGKLFLSLKTLPIFLGRVNWGQMFKDPYSLPYLRPRDADSVIRDIVKETLPEETKNVKLSALLGAHAEAEEQKLIATLASMEPMSLKLGAGLYSLSNVAIKEKILGQFHTSSSVLKLGSRHGYKDKVQDALESDNSMLAHFSTKGKNCIVPWCEKHDCPTHIMDMVREGVVGRSLSNPSSPAPQHQFVLAHWSAVPTHMIRRSIKVVVDDGVNLLHTLRGKRACYIGSDTGVKRQKSPLALICPDSLDVSAMSLGEIRSWVGGEFNMTSLIDIMIQEKTFSDPATVAAAADTISGGCYQHRGRVPTLSQGAHINYDPVAMSYIRISTDTALDFAKKGGDYTIMFQSIKVTIASQLLHRLQCGEDISGEWAAILICNTCTQPVHDGAFDLAHFPSYSGFSLGTEKILQFRRLGYEYVGPEDVEAVSEGAHVFLAEKLISSAINHDHVYMAMELDRVTGSDDFALNPQASLTDLARADIKLLLMCIFQRIAIRPPFKDVIAHLCASVPEHRETMSPIKLIMDPIIAAGRLSDLHRLAGSYSLPEVESEREKVMLFAYLWRRLYCPSIRSWKYFLPDDSAASRVRGLLLKNKICSGDPTIEGAIRSCCDDSTLETLELLLDFRPVSNPQDSQRSMRAREAPMQRSSVCKLGHGPQGGAPVQNAALRDLSTGYGNSVLASQIYSIIDTLPDLPVWSIYDHNGAIGVLVGHKRTSYIHDPVPSSSMNIRLSNGPSSLSIDECSASYSHEYYVQNLGLTAPIRPTRSPLIIICSHGFQNKGITPLDDDWVLTKDMTDGGTLVGCPRRTVGDVWYCNKMPQVDERGSPNTILGFPTETRLSPYVRLKEFLDLDNEFTLKDVEQKVNDTLKAIETGQREQLSEIIPPLLIQSGADVQTKYRGYGEVMLHLWISQKFRSPSLYTMKWHRHLWMYHAGCACENVEWAEYKPKDTLLAAFVESLAYLAASEVVPEDVPVSSIPDLGILGDL
ncbi:RNA-dependent RNA polymerase [Wenzhou Crab Virus 1]|uniref:RNA-directed RNA polymerase n=1 Tax=Wenzhou Crab Virus 1 TaxID=1608091 RepID=A0A0B5KEZ2_9MONO|nr:RNA-dependent RNA polymerase [Wenzhou Crab Virus 1]AJG39154.1 RNA-dependent RNA polymerase [Wenzhou Crab Virus 1]